MNFNDDDRYLIHDETGEVLREVGYSSPDRHFIRLFAKERGGTWMNGLRAKYEAPAIAAANKMLRSGTRIRLSGGAHCAIGANMGTRRVWVHGPCGTMTMTRDEAAAFIHALEHSIEQIDIAEFRESTNERATA